MLLDACIEALSEAAAACVEVATALVRKLKPIALGCVIALGGCGPGEVVDVEGVVRDGRTGAPIAGAYVSTRNGTGAETNDDGRFTVAGTDKSLGLADVSLAAYVPHNYPLEELEPGLEEQAFFDPMNFNFPFGAYVCEVEIEPETGTVEVVRYNVVYDVGVELNPTHVRGQAQGAIAMGMGQALMEQMTYDSESGQVLTGSFMDYCMPRAADFCHMEFDSHPVPTATNPLGVKGAGEGGTVGSLPAVMNAVNDALAPLGIRNLAMPATPQRIWRAVSEAKAQSN